MNRSSTLTQQLRAVPTILKLGHSGAAISDLQIAINYRMEALGMSERISVRVDGIFGSETRDGVRYLQCVGGLPVDGVVDDRTGLFIYEGAAGLPTLRRGSRGTLVVALQQAILKAQIRVAADGLFGPMTEQGTRLYQRKFGLVEDGTVGMRTWEAIVRDRTEGIPCAALLPFV